jgi:hypothetical protein
LFEVCQFSKENFYRVLSNNRFDETEVAKNPRANYLCGYLSKIEAITIAVENHLPGIAITQLLKNIP